MPELSNIREHLGWLVGRTIVDVTAGDPPGIPDADPSDEDFVVIHLDNGGHVSASIDPKAGFTYCNPDDPADPSDGRVTPDPDPR